MVDWVILLNPSWSTHWAYCFSSQCFKTGVTKVVMCSVFDAAYKRLVAANQKAK